MTDWLLALVPTYGLWLIGFTTLASCLALPIPASIIMLAFERNDGRRASFWAERMMSLPEPKEKDRPWTHEVKWYGWAGLDLAARSYRLADNSRKADGLQWAFHKYAQQA